MNSGLSMCMCVHVRVYVRACVMQFSQNWLISFSHILHEVRGLKGYKLTQTPFFVIVLFYFVLFSHFPFSIFH